ncbi:MAG TPA: hypothetical protein VEY95_12935 [Azospirillaceae bacterium]|nr:hypothetical protein [Azospirillaceae bacterium]
MFSLSKLLALAAIIAAVWAAFKWYRRIALLKERLDADPARTGRDGPRRQVEEMVRCRTCGTFVAAGGGACGRDGCPQARHA